MYLIHTYLGPFYRPAKNRLMDKKNDIFLKQQTARLSNIGADKKRKGIVFYFGIPKHSNLGDMAQYYCIHKWICKNYSDEQLFEFQANVVVNDKYNFIKKFKSIYQEKDLIIFQSGYTTQDLGGLHDYMHRMVIDNIPHANILMLPQTVFFKKIENKRRTALSYNAAEHMLFLSRDNISFEMAKEMFPDIKVLNYPDIVTSLIGSYTFTNKRKGVCICRRNDGEKYYPENEILSLAQRLQKEMLVDITDTTINVSYKKIRKNIKKYLDKEIENFSNYEVIITDRYHGTIFSLAAGTPVIIIKTNDHKVVTGADWFKGVYDDYVYLADSLEDAYNLVLTIRKKHLSHTLKPYFSEKYYDVLKGELKEVLSNE